MIGRRTSPKVDTQDVLPVGFDDFDLKLGDVMRGERATLGKSLLDVQRELKIKATYIAAIENADTDAFETQGFIAGYVRSYSRYLGLDPEWAFATFCREAGFQTTSALDKPGTPGTPRSAPKIAPADMAGRDPLASPRVSFAPSGSSAFTGVEPRAIGSTLVLFALIGAIGFGGWSVLKEVQRVQMTPVDSSPDVVAEVDPVAQAQRSMVQSEDDAPQFAGVAASTPDALNRLYRPEALDVPVMVARDGPIAALDPGEFQPVSQNTEVAAQMGPNPAAGAEPRSVDRLANVGPALSTADAIAAAVGEAVGQGIDGAATPRVTAEGLPEVVLLAVRPAWVRVRAADGSVLYERTMAAGDSWVVPQTEEAPTLRAGAAGAVFFAVNGQTYGPAGANGAVVDKIALASPQLTTEFAAVDPAQGGDAVEAVRVAEAALAPELPGQSGTAVD
ncbi:DUF4115 domain-containing protein [Roseicyclus sp. F158]|uniref:DUF4115 domain-containing protein n=1 Tax=Tropicimonas omnivorans TaxID=3075590 RepID=A0ABU3DKM5_9RHOB|nr:RodZ domain-containing protein [Roseicyclus sp. F158]MDT0683667.1 DUF4115 domain-containing protein [Roseicyclus sp. F158]